MSGFFTSINIPQPDFRIDYQSKLYFTGSCFSENIGLRFKQLKFPVCVNPFGVQYNPFSITNSLHKLLDKDCYYEEDLNFENELWFSFSHYTLFSDPDQQKCLDKINSSFSAAKNFISEADIIVITLGTSWAYLLKDTDQIVSNCHKLPAKRFNRTSLSTGQSVSELSTVIKRIKGINPQARFIFTVSPIRHWKDGAIENQRSKAELLLTIAQLEKELNDVYYFPAYEIMMDELRDYRFYASDMLHPSDQAIDYIWKRFTDTYFTEETVKATAEIEQLINSLNHRPIHTSTNNYKKFIFSIRTKLESLLKKYPNLDFSPELNLLSKK